MVPIGTKFKKTVSLLLCDFSSVVTRLAEQVRERKGDEIMRTEISFSLRTGATVSCSARDARSRSAHCLKHNIRRRNTS